MLKRLFFHRDYQKHEINCHNRSYPKRTQAICFIFLAREEFWKLLHVIIHTKRIGFPELADSSCPTNLIGARARVYICRLFRAPAQCRDERRLAEQRSPVLTAQITQPALKKKLASWRAIALLSDTDPDSTRSFFSSRGRCL